jgi:alpha-galactosidase
VWRKPVSADGSVAVLIINGALLAQNITVPLSSINVSTSTASVRDLFAHADIGSVARIEVVLQPHDAAMLLVTPHSS